MNRKKINSIILMLGTVLTVNLGSSIDVRALEADNDVPELQQHQNADKDKNMIDLSNSVVNQPAEEENIADETENIQDQPVEAVNETPEEEATEVSDETSENATPINNETSESTGNPESTDNSLNEDKTVENDLKDQVTSDVAAETPNAIEDKNQETQTDPIADKNQTQVDKIETENPENTEDEVLDEEETEEEVISYEATYTQEDKDAAFNRICQGEGAKKDYVNILGFRQVTTTYLGTINVAAKKKADAGDLTIDNLNDVINEAIEVYEFLGTVDDGDADLDSYTSFGLKNVNDNNIDDVNALLQNRPYMAETADDDFALVNDIQGYINKCLASIKAICSGNAKLDDYTNIGIADVTEEALPQVNEGIKEQADLNNGTLSLERIQEIIPQELSKVETIVKISGGTALAADYAAIGITDIAAGDIDYINSKIVGYNVKTVSQVKNAIEDISKIFVSIKNICSKNGSLDDYRILEIEGVDDSTLDFVNSNMNVEYNGYSSLEEIKKSVKDSLDKLKLELIKKVTDGTAECSDYEQLGASGVTETNKEFINNRLKGKEYASMKAVQDAVQSALDILDAIEKINKGEGEKENYNKIEISGITDDNISFVNEQLKGNTSYDIEEIQNKAADAIAKFGIFDRINQGNAEYEDFKAIGVDINEDEVVEANSILKGKNYRNAEDIQAVLKGTFKVNYAIKNINSGKAELISYRDLDLNNVTNKNLGFVNEGMAGQNLTTEEEVKKRVNYLVSLYDSITKINAGKATLSDYELIEVGTVNEDNLSFVNSYVNGNTSYKLSEVQKYVQNAVDVYDTVQKVNRGEASYEDYKFLNILRVTSSNTAFINENIPGNTFKTVADIQDFVTHLLDCEDAKLRIGDGSAKINDYQLLNIKNVTYENVEFITKYIKGKTYTEVSEIQVAVNQALAIYEEVLDINNGNGTMQNYTDVEAEGVTFDNIYYVNDYIKEDPRKGLDDLRTQIKKAVKEYDLVQLVKNGAAELGNYNNLKIYGVTSANVDFMNQYMLDNASKLVLGENESQLAIKEKIQDLVREANVKFDALTRINNGKANVDDYTETMNVDKVTDENYKYVNFCLQGKNLTDSADIQKAVNDAVSEFETVKNINEGLGTSADFAEIYKKMGLEGQSPVDSQNAKFINDLIVTTDVTTPYAIKDFVEKALAKYTIVKRIDSGKGEIEDYNTLGLDGVTKNNLQYINSYMEGNNYDTLKQVQERFDNATRLAESIQNLREGNGKPADYSNLNVEGVTTSNIDFVNAELRDQNLKDQEDVQVAVKEAVDLYNAMERIRAGEGSVADYELIDNNLDIVSANELHVSVSNLKFVNGALKGNILTSPVDLRDAEVTAIKKYDAILKSDKGLATVEEYKLLGVYNISEGQCLSYVNGKLIGVASKYAVNGVVDYNVLDSLVKEGNYYVKAFEILNKINEGTATYADFSTIKILAVTDDNVQFVSENLKGLNLSEIEAVSEKADEFANMFTSVSKINQGLAKLSDYDTLKVTGVDNNNLIYVNADLKNDNSLTVQSIQEKINEHKNIYASLKNINEGIASLEDYVTIGAESVTDETLKFVNEYMKGENQVTALAAVKEVEQILIKDGAYGRINAGEGTLKDYNTVGALNVNEDNIDYINAEIKSTLDSFGKNIQDMIDKIISLYNTSFAINQSEESKVTIGSNIYVKEYYDLNKTKVLFDTTEGSQFDTIKKCVQLSRRIANNAKLNKDQIVDILDKVTSYPDDAKFVIKEITKKLANIENNSQLKLKGEQVESNIADLIEYIKLMTVRVSSGIGTVEDFDFLGENRVNDENIDLINIDIKQNNTISTLSEYRLKGVTAAVNQATAVERINNNLAVLNDYKLIGYTAMGDSTAANSLFDLVNRAIDLQREVNGNRYLTRTEILTTIDKVSKSQNDAAAVLDLLRREVDSKKAASSTDLTPEEEQKIIDDVLKTRTDIILRISAGKGTIDDYKYLGETLRVNEDNIDVINTDIEQNATVKKLSDLRVDKLAEAVTDGIAIYDINNGKESAVSNNFKLLKITTSFTTENRARACTLIEKYVKLKRKMKAGEFLTRTELVEIANEVVNNLDNQEIILSQINDELTAREIEGEELTPEKVTEIFNNIKSTRQKVCYDIVNGIGTLEDYEYLKQTQVTADNIDVINNDIKENKTVILNGLYKLEGLDKAVQQGIAVYYLNNNSDKTAQEKFTAIGLNVPYSPEDDSYFNLVEIQIKLQRRIVKDRYLTRQEIKTIANDIKNNLDDMKVILPSLNEKLDSQERSQGVNLTPEEAQNLLDTEKKERYEACQRIAAGNGEVKDYKALGETRVTDTNIGVINKDIKDSKKISIASSYRLNGLEDAVTRGLAIFTINNNNDKSVEQSFTIALDLNETNKIPYDTQETSLFNLVISQIRIQRALNNGDYLSRSEIVNIINDIRGNETNFEDQKVIIPKVTEAMNAKQKAENRDLTSDEVQQVINEVKDKLSKVCKSIVDGEGTAEDYNYLGQKKVTEQNINIVNNDIKTYGGISLLTSYRIGGLEDAVTRGLAVYTINRNKDMTLVNLFESLGVEVEYSTEDTSRFNLITSQIEIQRKINDGAYLSRKEILDIINDIDTNIGDKEVIIPRVVNAIKDKEKTLEAELKPEEVQQIITEVQNTIKEVCKRVAEGNGKAADYNYLGENRVTDENINIINNDIKTDKKIELLTSYRIGGLTEAVRKGLAVYAINNNNDKTVVDDFKALGVELTYDTNETSEFGIICSKVRVQRLIESGAYIDRKAILDIVTYVKENLEDLKVSMPEINSKIEELEKENAGAPLTTEQVQELSDLVQNGNKEVCQRVYKGLGTVDDFKKLGETRVTEDNLKVINNDIKTYGTITLLSSYRLEGLKEAVDQGLAVYNINNNNNDDATANDFNKIGIDVKAESTTDGSLSKLKVLESEVTLKRMIEGGRYLSREEIKNISVDVTNNLDDKKIIISKVNEQLAIKQDEALTADDVNALISSVKENIEKVCKRIYLGNGSVEDFIYLGETRVNSDNIKAVNNDIQTCKSVTLLSNYTLKGLEEAVSDGLALYGVNTATENSAIDDFAAIGVDLTYDTSETSLFKLMQAAIKLDRKVKDNEFLTRHEIQDIKTKIVDHFDDAAIVIPALVDAVNNEEKEEGKTLTAAETAGIIASTQNECKQRIIRMCAGEATVADYIALGEKRITSNIIDIANAEVKEYRTITKVSDYRLNDITSAMDEILALYDINCGFETEAHDVVQIKNNYGNVLRTYNTNYRVKQYEVFGQRVEWDKSEKSELTLIREAIKIMRTLNEGRYLTRSEILNTIVAGVKGDPETARTILPRIYNALNDSHTSKGADLTHDEAQKVIDDEKAKMKDVVNRIVAGKAYASDYNYVGAAKVTDTNVDAINTDVKLYGTIGRLNDIQVTNLDNGVNLGIAIYNINNSSVSKDANEFALIGRDDIKYDESETSLFKLILSYISILRYERDGKLLNRNEILNAIQEVITNQDDWAILIPKVKSELDNQKSTYPENFTGENAQKTAEDIDSKLKTAVNNIYAGKASVDDFVYVGETRVNKKNLDTVNKDIQKYRSVTRISDYRLGNLDDQITKALAVYNINKNNISKDANNNAKEYAVFGINTEYSYDETSALRLAQNYISIQQKLNYYEDLDRQEILDAIDEVIGYTDQYEYMVPEICSQIADKEDEKEDFKLSYEEVDKIVTDVQTTLNRAAKRLAAGNGKLEDYSLFGEPTRVTVKNYKYIGDDIKATKSVKLSSNYSVQGLTQAVDKALAAYKLNNGIENKDADGYVKELKALGADVESSTEQLSLDKLIMTAIKIAIRENNSNLITSTKIIEIIDDIQTHFAVAQVKIPKIMSAINDKDEHEDRIISGDEVTQIIEDISNQVEEVLK